MKVYDDSGNLLVSLSLSPNISSIADHDMLYWDSASGTWVNGVAATIVANLGITASITELNYVDGVTSAIQTQLDAKVAKATLDAHTILYAITDDTPAALAVAEQRLVGRITGGNIAALTATQVRTLINVEDGATKYPDTGEQAFLDADHTKLDGIAAGADVTADNAPQAHKDSHDPADGGDALDCAAAGEIVGVAAAAEGSAHSFARSDHTHQVQHSIADNHIVTIDHATPVDNDYAKFTASGLEGRSYSEVVDDIGSSIDTVGTVTSGNVDAVVTDATTAAKGKVELAIASEINTGTDATRANTPDALAGSNFGIRYVQMIVFDFATAMATGDGKFYFHIPPALTGMNLVYCHAEHVTAGTGTGTDTSDIQIHNATDAADMLSTKLTVDEDETGSDTAATAYVINGAADDVATNDVLRVDVDAVTPTSAPQGLILTLGFQLP